MASDPTLPVIGGASPNYPWGNWMPNIPDPWDYMAGLGNAGSNTGGWQAEPGANPWAMPTAITNNFGDMKWWQDPKNQNAIQAYSAAMQPFYQYRQDAYSYAKDFNEAQRRWNEEQSWNQGRDTFNMALGTRQQNAAEKQWGDQFGLSQQQFAHTQGQDLWGRGFQEKQLGEQGKQARYAAFGRAQAPSSTWVRNW